MLAHPQCGSIDIASRGVAHNDDFFYNEDSNELYAVSIANDFCYEESGSYFNQGLIKVDFRSYDLIFLRMPRPISDEFLTWIKTKNNKAVFINDPIGIINTSNKHFLLKVKELCPPIEFVSTSNEIIKFVLQHSKVVLKPLRGYGGAGILKIDGNEVECEGKTYGCIEYLKDHQEEIEDGYLAMKFLKNVSNGDKRILVVGGEILAASLRLPAEDSWLCNVAQGGKSVKTEITKEEVEIVKVIAPFMKEEGILIYGIDTLEDDTNKRVLSEINTLSIGGFSQSEKQTGLPILANTIDRIFIYADEKS